MTDVVEAALRYRQQLRAELKRLDGFVSYAESLARDDAQKLSPIPASEGKPGNPPLGGK